MIPVVWVDYPAKGKNINRGYWDQGLLELTFQRSLHAFEHHEGFIDADGAVVVVPAGYHADDVDRLNADLARYTWALVILTSDERSVFPWRKLDHPNMALWVMTPRPAEHDPADARFLGEGFKADTPQLLVEAGRRTPTDFFYAGQVNHDRRRDCVTAMRECENGTILETGGFTKGLDRPEYLARLAASKFAPCPSGPATPDTFRLYEALEAGVVPIADGHCPAYPEPGYWQHLLQDEPPFPVVTNWDELPGLLNSSLNSWPTLVNRCFAWWQRHKAQLVANLETDLHRIAGIQPPGTVTVLIPTSPIPSHPETWTIEATVASVQHHLPDARIVVMIDGVRSEQEKRRKRYTDYTRRLLRLCNQWQAVPLLFEEHTHQAAMTRTALEHVATPLVLFVEHDTPLVTDEPIAWRTCEQAILDGHVDLVRFHHEAHILPEHQHLMLDAPLGDLARTVQWSQRPHLASTAYYRHILGTEFDPEDVTMIEDVMHGVVQKAWERDGELGWCRHRLSIYNPEGGNIKRSLHSDGREYDPKFKMLHRGRWR